MTNDEIIAKIKEVYSLDASQRYSLKIYCIIGYPWENERDADLAEIKNILRQADKPEKTHQIILTFLFSHFVSMSLTPMAFERLNMINFRRELISKRNYLIHQGINIMAYVSQYATSPVAAIEELFIERSYESGYTFCQRFFLSPRYRGAKTDLKLHWLQKYLDIRFLREYEIDEPMPTDYLETGLNYRVAAKAYRKKTKELSNFNKVK